MPAPEAMMPQPTEEREDRRSRRRLCRFMRTADGYVFI